MMIWNSVPYGTRFLIGLRFLQLHVDASKAFDRLDHCKLINKLRDRNFPSCFVRVISSW